MKDVEGGDGNDDEDALEADKHALVRHDGASPPFAQLGNAKGRPPEDAKGRQRQGAQKQLEAQRVAHGSHGGALVKGVVAPKLALASPRAQGKVDRGDDEEEDGGHLEGESGNHDVGAQVGRVVVVRGHGGDGASEGLKNERDDVAGDELQDYSLASTLEEMVDHL